MINDHNLRVDKHQTFKRLNKMCHKGKAKGKGQNIDYKERTSDKATERHLSYGIT